MRALLLDAPGQKLRLDEVPLPETAPHQIRLRVRACGLCRTDLHVVDGDLTDTHYPIIPGHQIVGIVESVGNAVTGFHLGDRVGIPWLGSSCGECRYCRSGRENLCDLARYTGYHLNGGFAEYCVADARFAFPIPSNYPDLQAAPLLCAGLIGYRALRMAGDAQRLGFYGFGAAAHILIQIARYQGREVHAFTRPGDRAAQNFARQLGAVWAGDSSQIPPVPLEAAIIFAPIGELVPQALQTVEKGGMVVCAGIQMSDIPTFPLFASLGRTTSLFGCQPDPTGTEKNSSHGPRGPVRGPKSPPFRSKRRTRRSTICARAVSPARR